MSWKREVYTSFHEIPPREYMYFPKGTLEMGKPGKTSKTELVHLTIALIILTFAFSFPLSHSSLFFKGIDINNILNAVPIAFFGLLTAFFVHELSHKFMAQRYGLWSEFRMFPESLIFSSILAVLTGVIFAAPGSVIFRGEPRPFEMGRIAAAGSAANIIIAAVTLPFFLFVFFENSFLGWMVGSICFVNALLATFNLLPFSSLDGSKVIWWNEVVWAILFGLALIITIIIFPRYIITFY